MTLIAAEATKTVPIVDVGAPDPVDNGADQKPGRDRGGNSPACRAIPRRDLSQAHELLAGAGPGPVSGRVIWNAS